jgi:alkylated DNA repair dioxygenase AlkB
MSYQKGMFEGERLPPGFFHWAEVISASEEAQLLSDIEGLQFEPYVFQGFTAKRRIVVFGKDYDPATRAITEGAPIPEFLLPVRTLVARLAGVPPEEFAEALITEYSPGTPIGWHRDSGPFELVAGVSLNSSCEFKLRKGEGGEEVALILEPRSAYLMSGEARWEWQHHIPPTKGLRYSITFRTLRVRPEA